MQTGLLSQVLRQIRPPVVDSGNFGYFNDTAVGWLMKMLFFPSGIISLGLALFFLARKAPEASNEKNIKKAGHLLLQDNSLRRLNSDEIHRLCKEYALPRKRQVELQKNGVLDGYKCGLCIGGDVKKKYLQLPCGHFHHVYCLEDALEQDLATCPECGWSIKSIFDIHPMIPAETK